MCYLRQRSIHFRRNFQVQPRLIVFQQQGRSIHKLKKLKFHIVTQSEKQEPSLTSRVQCQIFHNLMINNSVLLSALNPY